MAFNPVALVKLKERYHMITEDHPKLMPFLKAIRANALMEGTILEIKVKNPEGKEFLGNIKLTERDLETINMFFK